MRGVVGCGWAQVVDQQPFGISRGHTNLEQGRAESRGEGEPQMYCGIRQAPAAGRQRFGSSRGHTKVVQGGAAQKRGVLRGVVG